MTFLSMVPIEHVSPYNQPQYHIYVSSVICIILPFIGLIPHTPKENILGLQRVE
jgi:hypothetical protein